MLLALKLLPVSQYDIQNRALKRRLRAEIRNLPEDDFRQTARRLARNGLATFNESSGVIRLTSKGSREAIARSLGVKKLAMPTLWDGVWRMVCFDVPKYKNSRRRLLREGLIALGFHPIQQSVFVHPGECRIIVEELASALGLEREVVYVEAELPSRDAELRCRFFKKRNM